jgi:hypothetical protein
MTFERKIPDGKWCKIDPPIQLGKAWFVKKLSIEDIILGRWEIDC